MVNVDIYTFVSFGCHMPSLAVCVDAAAVCFVVV